MGWDRRKKGRCRYFNPQAMKIGQCCKVCFFNAGQKKTVKEDSGFLWGDKKCGFGGLCLFVIYLFRCL